jgi:hypothetical protein
LFWRAMPGDMRWRLAPALETIAVTAGATIEVASGPAGAGRTETSAVGGSRLAALARRVLTEARDRALPSIHLIARTRRSSRLA